MIIKDGVVVITGARGVGKTFLAATCVSPRELGSVFYHDTERSANRFRQQMQAQNLDFGYYGDLSARFSDLPENDDLLARIERGDMPWIDKAEKRALLGYYHYIISDLHKNLKRGKHRVYVLDTLEKFEAGMAAHAEENITDFGYRSYRDAMKHGRFWSDAVYGLYEQLVSAVFNRGIEMIVLCSHLKTPWRDNEPVPGKVAPSGKKLLYRLASLMLWLVNESENADGAPAGLVLKERLGLMTVVDGQWQPRRLLPERVPHCTWADIEHYLESGANLENPTEGEVMSPAERNMISELLTDEQMKLMILRAEEKAAERGGVAVQSPSGQVELPVKEDPKVVQKRQEAQALLDQGLSREEVREQLIGAYPPPLQKSGRAAQVVDAALGGL